MLAIVTAALRDGIFAATYRLADLEAFELLMVEVEQLVLAGVPMGKTECPPDLVQASKVALLCHTECEE
jgi:hypothetical protein